MTNINHENEVIVIGAGASGLGAAYEINKRGIPVRIIEKAQRAGEAWHHRHPQLHLNTHRKLSKLPGMEIPKEAGVFPSRNCIIRYLSNYAEKLDVPIDYGVTVKTISFHNGFWSVETNCGTYTAIHIVLATGYDSIPYIPSWPGREIFKKKLIHAAEFGELSNYQDKKVLVVGAGNSGTDILNHLSRIKTKNLWVSVRHGPVVFPKRLFGLPMQLLSLVLAKLPVSLVDRMLLLTEFIAFGNLKKWGLKKHPVGGATRLLKTGTAPAIDNGFIAALKTGKAVVVEQIQKFEESSVRLTNGQEIEPDIVVAATGYRTGLESFLKLPELLNELGIPTIHGSQQQKSYPGLFFIGMQPRLPGNFHDAGVIGKEIASVIESEHFKSAVFLDKGLKATTKITV